MGRAFPHWRRWVVLAAACAPLPAGAAAAADGMVSPTELTTERVAEPLGIDAPAPRLGWVPVGRGRGLRQSAYQVLVATSPQALAADGGDLWDSGKVVSGETVNIAYAGARLASRASAWWKVRVWDGQGRPSAWSRPAHFTMGLLHPTDWAAGWIDRSNGEVAALPRTADGLLLPPASYFRRSFAVTGKVKRATLYSTALGLVEMRLNGSRVGDDWFAPGWTDYDKRLHYRTFDVTPLVRAGDNALGALLADGWYAGYVGYARVNRYERQRGFWGARPNLLAQLEIEYDDGRREVVKTDDGWRTTDGAIREADILMGETFDARLEPVGWDRPGFDDRGWKQARDTSSASYRGVRPSPRLQAYPGAPTRVHAELKPVRITEPRPGAYVFDMGRNIAGVARLKVKGPAGARVRLRFGEMLNPDGTILTANLRAARATDTYVLRGDPAGEVWEPRFTYHGFQYVEVTGFPGVPGRDAVTALQLTADAAETGSISIDGDIPYQGGRRGLITQLLENIQTTQMANFIEIPTDCPQRDERLGWTGDIQVYARSASYFRDVDRFLGKWTADLADAQVWTGAYPVFAPTPFSKDQASPAWEDAGVIVPYELWRAYGDRGLLERRWDSMSRYMEHQREVAGPDHLHPGEGVNFADWVALDKPTSAGFVATAYYAHDATLMAAMAEALGRRDEAARYRLLAREVRDAFRRRYGAPNGALAEETQTAYALAIQFGLLPDADRPAAAARLAGLIHAAGDKITTGFLGTKYVIPSLAEFGHGALAYKLLTRTENPSWGYSVVNGATSIWERWDGYTKGKGFNDPGMNSFSHYAFGAVAEWMFSGMGGIRASSPGFATAVIAPEVDGAPFRGVTTRYRSIRGVIGSSWRRTGDALDLAVEVPVNVTAVVNVPAADAASVREGKMPAARSPGVAFIGYADGVAQYSVGSGAYRFRSTLPKPGRAP